MGLPSERVNLDPRRKAELPLGRGRSLPIGETARSRVELTDPACFQNWDATGRCRFFTVTPSRDGELRLVLSWSTPSATATDLMDLFLVRPDGSWTYADPTKGEQRRMSQTVSANTSYVAVVMAYGASVDFELTTEM